MTLNVNHPRAIVALLIGIVLLVALSSGPAQAATTFTVNKSGDARDTAIDGVCDTAPAPGSQCTLRAAIQEANATANSGGPDEIDFAIGGTATVKTIAPTRPLPAITESVTIDGYTQGSQTADTSDDAEPNDNPIGQGTDAVIKVQLKGTNAGATANGLRLTASESTIKGLAINRFAQSGILIRGAGATGNKVEGNFIGTNASGTRALPNLGDGVRISGAPENTIGGTELPAQRNLLSGNGSDGVEISGSGAELNKVEGNLIGTDASGTQDLGNAGDGVHIEEAPNNTIGPGTVFNGLNLISGNDSDGIAITGSGATGNTAGTNFIEENSVHGVHIQGASNNTIGEGFPGNSILNNGGDGVFVSSGTGNHIAAFNGFGGNGGLGIDLSGGTEDSFGVTANDEDDPDTGANNLQNFPVITSVHYDDNTDTTTISGTLNSTPNQTFLIVPYTSFSFEGDPSDHGEGEGPFSDSSGTGVLATTDANGDATFSFEVIGFPGAYVTATATNVATGDTSEFSKNVGLT